jgi:hypothetical protein
MKTKLLLFLLLPTVYNLAILPASAALGNVVRNVRITSSVDLAPTADAPAGAAGEAVIKIHQVNDFQSARIRLTLAGLTAGVYQLKATLVDTSVVGIGTFRATPAGKPAEPGKDDGTIVRLIPPAVDATKIVKLAIADANAIVVLEGDATVDVTRVNFFANVTVTGPLQQPSGHVVVHSRSVDGVESRRYFLWVAFGAAPNTVLTINVDGTAVGSVTSTAFGKVVFFGLDPSVDLTTMKLITLTDTTGAVVMQAHF